MGVKISFLLNLPKEVEEMKELVVRVRVARAGEGGLGEEVDKKLLACWPSVWLLAEIVQGVSSKQLLLHLFPKPSLPGHSYPHRQLLHLIQLLG